LGGLVGRTVVEAGIGASDVAAGGAVDAAAPEGIDCEIAMAVSRSNISTGTVCE